MSLLSEMRRNIAIVQNYIRTAEGSSAPLSAAWQHWPDWTGELANVGPQPRYSPRQPQPPVYDAKKNMNIHVV